MSTPCAIPTHPDRPSIVVIDSKKLRQAGIVHLLGAWADAKGWTVRAVASDSRLDEQRTNASCEMVIFSVGSESVAHPQQQALIRSVRAHMPQAALVVISDREEAKEVCAAFDEGAAGFMPTSIDPSVALQALAFIKCGGSFFPPSALAKACSRPEMPSVRGHVAVNGSERAIHLFDESRGCPAKLSAKQEEVFRLLRQGPSNKAIARQLGVSEATVKVHIRGIMRKFGVANRTQVAVAAMKDVDESFLDERIVDPNQALASATKQEGTLGVSSA
jgi:DNA-binding NarL/FixJ family response regulator